MTQTYAPELAVQSDGGPAPASRAADRLQPLRALRAMRRLIADKEDTAQVFEIMAALTGRAVPRGYARLIATPAGGAIAFRRAELAEFLSDDIFLDRCPAGSVGAAYADFMRSERITARGLAAESLRVKNIRIEAQHPFAWYARRLRDSHDLWHVLTGFGRDALGELCLMAFSFGQTRDAGFAFIALMGGREVARKLPGQPVWTALWQAYRCGAQAQWLPGEDLVRLLAEPLEGARRRLGVTPPAAYGAIPAELRQRVLARV